LRKILFIFILVVIFMGGSLCDSKSALASEEPIQVWTAEDLNNVRNNLSGNYIQMADIDLSGYSNWEPIGGNTPFVGTYDGNGHVITNLTINRPTTECVGLFGQIVRSYPTWGALTNITLRNVYVVGESKVGGLVGENLQGGAIVGINNCKVSGTVHAVQGSVGGIAGYISTTRLIKSSFEGTVEIEGTGMVGGIVGCAYGAGGNGIEECYSLGRVQAIGNSSCQVGGIAGYLDNCALYDSYSKAFVRGQSGHTGGILGYHGYYGSAYHCYFAGDLETSYDAVGRANECYYDNEVTDCTSSYAIGKTTAQMKTQATFVGWDFDTIWNINPDINDGYPYLKNFSLTPIQIWTAQDLYNTRDNLNGNYIQMADIDLSGYLNWEPITQTIIIDPNPEDPTWHDIPFSGTYDGNNHTIRNLTINNMNHYSSLGLFMDIASSSVVRNVRLDNVNITGSRDAGALASSSYGKIINCHSNGSIYSEYGMAGGLLGSCLWDYYAPSYVSTVENCSSSVKVEIGVDGVCAGGLIGKVGWPNCEVKSCYSLGEVISPYMPPDYVFP